VTCIVICVEWGFEEGEGFDLVRISGWEGYLGCFPFPVFSIGWWDGGVVCFWVYSSSVGEGEGEKE